MKPYHHLLTLSGYGYLHGIITNGNQTMARLKAVTHFNPSHEGQEDVWIECQVTDRKQLAYLNCLLNSVHAGEKVMVTFEAEYTAFINAYSGQTAEDPNQIVTLQGKLLALGDSYINGCLVEQNKVPLRAIA